VIARFFRRQPEPPAPAVRVLLVCMGNICRSPLAEGVLRARLAARAEGAGEALPVLVDSAGTHGYHAGTPPDPRAQAAAARRGIDISALRARQVTSEDLVAFDLVVAMDDDNLAALRGIAPPDHVDKPRLLLEFAADVAAGRNVPDPYYGGMTGFERVLDLVESAMDGLVAEVERLLAERGAATGAPGRDD
jgi:protein-tyrosine phosphatase